MKNFIADGQNRYFILNGGGRMAIKPLGQRRPVLHASKLSFKHDAARQRQYMRNQHHGASRGRA